MIQEEHEEHHYSIRSLCKLGGITRAAYYKWLNRKETANDRLNKQISDRLEAIHQEHPDMGYRSRKQQIKSNLKYRYDGCTRPSKNPAFIAENILNRDFHADSLNEKWVTDVTEFKYGTSFDHIYKLYLSVILDLCDHCPVAYVLSDHNNNQLVFDTFDQAVKNNHRLLHK